MRLRAVLSRQRRLLDVVRTLQKVTKDCTMKISPTEVVLAASPGSLTEPQAWASMKSVSHCVQNDIKPCEFSVMSLIIEDSVENLFNAYSKLSQGLLFPCFIIFVFNSLNPKMVHMVFSGP
jgi:hypothetical protein